MDIFNVLTLIGGLCLFLFGMNVMGESLESAVGRALGAGHRRSERTDTYPPHSMAAAVSAEIITPKHRESQVPGAF